MANEKISQFTVDNNLISYTGFAGYVNAGGGVNLNRQISGQYLRHEIINSNNSAQQNRIPFYGSVSSIGGGADNDTSLGGSESFKWDETNHILQIGVPGGGNVTAGKMELIGNYLAGDIQPKITFKGGESTTPNSFDFTITTAENAVDQSWILPSTLPTAGQVLEANAVASNDVTLSWVTPASGGGGGYQTLTPGASVTWAAGSGLSAELTPSVTSTPNTISMTGFSAGDSGTLKIIPTTTSAFRLPANSKAAGGDIDISKSNPSVLEYFYDGTTFYWWPEANMIDPIYFPVINETGLVAFYVPNTYTGGAGNVSSGSAWVNSFTSNNLIGDLTRQGTDADDVQFIERDDATSTPAHFRLGADGTSTGYFDRATNLVTSSFVDWTGVIWVLANAQTSVGSYGALMDGDKDDDEAMYMDERRFCLYTTGGSYIYSNFPALVDAGDPGNDNAFDLEDEWVYFGLSMDNSEDEITFFIGCQATFDNASGTILGYDGNPISIDANGLYTETVAATLGEDPWNNFIIGAASSGSFNYEGAIGMAAVYNQTTDLTTHTQNWNNTKEYYYIT